MGGALRELLVDFGIGLDDGALKRGEGAIDGLIGKAKEAGKVFLEAFAIEKIGEFFKAQIEGAAHVQDLADRLDVTATTIQRFGFAAKGAGVDLDSAAHSLGFLQKNLGEAETGGGEAAQAFQKLGVHIKDASGKARPLTDVIFDVADGMAKLPDQNQRAAMAMKVFVREGRAMVPILAKGSGAIRELFKDADELSSGLGDDYFAAAKAAREESEHFAFAIASIKQRITSAALPAIMKIVGVFQTAAKRVIGLDKRFHIFGDSLAFLGGFAGLKAVWVLFKIAKIFGILKPSVWQTILAFAKFALPLAILGAIVLVVQDLWTWMRGGKSVIGDAVTAALGFDDANKLLATLRDVWTEIVAAFEPMIPDLEEAAKWIVKAFIDNLPDIITFAAILAVNVVGALDSVITTAREAADVISELLSLGGNAAQHQTNREDLALGESERAAKRDQAQKKLEDLATGLALNHVASGNDPTGAAGAQAAIAFRKGQSNAANGFSGPPPQDVTINQTIHTASDPKAVGDAASKGTANAIQRANYNAKAGLKKP